MKKILSIVLMVVFALAFTACAKQSVAPAPKTETVTETKIVIDQMALKEFQEKWPVISNTKQAKALGLYEVILTEPVWAFNLLNKPKENPYRLEQLPIGTKVWAEGNGIPRYKSDCLNPIYVPTKREIVSTAPAPALMTPAMPVKSGGGFWASMWKFLGKLFQVLMIALVILFFLAALWAMWKAFGTPTTKSTTTVTSVPAPVTPAPAPTTLVPTPAPVVPVSAPTSAPVPAPATVTSADEAMISISKSGVIRIEPREVIETITIKVTGKEVAIKASRK